MMDYVAVSFITLVIASASQIILFKIYNKYNTKKIRPTGTQSTIYDAVKPVINHFVGYSYVEMNLNTQSQIHYTKSLQSDEVKVVLLNDDAYWIKDGIFYTAKFNDNKIIMETQKIVDTMSMDAVELDKISKVVDKLSERETYDFGNSGDQIF